MNIPLNTSVVSCVVLKEIDGEIKILLANRSDDNFWCHIAGKLEEGETGWQAIVREIKEEIDVSVSNLYSAEYIEQFYEPERNCITLVPVFVTYLRPDDSVVLNDEHTEFKWCSLPEAKKLAPYPNQHKLYDHVSNYFMGDKPDKLTKVKLS